MKRLFALLLVVVSRVEAQDVRAWVRENAVALLDLYQEMHRAPELSFQEEKSAARFAGALRDAGFEVTTGVGGHGVVAMLRNGEGRTLMLRTDLDALPLEEKTGLPYASTVKVERDDGSHVGVMHACGHDMHMTCLIAASRWLAGHRDAWRGTLMVIGQPAEEKVAGAEAMLKDGLFSRFPRPDYAVALHVSADLPVGRLGWRKGPAMANVDSVDVTMRGAGGHGSAPETTIDPVVQAAHLIVDLQTIVAREVKPGDPAVVTVGAIHGGTKHNIIGDSCHLQLTLRSYDDATRQHLKDAVVRKARAAAASARAPEPIVEFSEGCPALSNEAGVTGRVVAAFERSFGKEALTEVPPTMGAEDFALFGRAGIPSFMFRLGSIAPERLAGYARDGKTPPSLHSPLYYPDAPATIEMGTASLAVAAMELLPR